MLFVRFRSVDLAYIMTAVVTEFMYLYSFYCGRCCYIICVSIIPLLRSLLLYNLCIYYPSITVAVITEFVYLFSLDYGRYCYWTCVSSLPLLRSLLLLDLCIYSPSITAAVDLWI